MQDKKKIKRKNNTGGRRYIIRLDDASEHMNIENWIRMKNLLDKYGIKPIIGIIPCNKDSELLRYDEIHNFWQMMRNWQQEGWTPALHGYTHVFETNEGGINPVNYKSEFAGVPLEKQREKIRQGYKKLKSEGIEPLIFFAPAHTFDGNTLKALEEETEIRVISDTIASDVYFKKPFYYIPQQSGRARRLPFRTVTFCYHPNIMKDDDYDRLDHFLSINGKLFISYNYMTLRNKGKTAKDILLNNVYFLIRKVKRKGV